MSDEFPRCATAARERGDLLAGTAAPATGWLLVEVRTGWSPRPFSDPAAPPVLHRIGQLATQRGLRPLLIRRHGRRGHDREHRFAVVRADPAEQRWGTFVHLEELAHGDWGGLTEVTTATYLVCAHARHDRCCAIAGRPVAAAVAAARPHATWESSHLGGDRFAANLLVLPHGATYGFVESADVPAIVAATERGEVHLPRLRGRSTEPAHLQAARIAAQRRCGLVGFDEPLLLDLQQPAPGRWQATFATDAATIQVSVAHRERGGLRLTCTGPPTTRREWHVTELVERARGSGVGPGAPERRGSVDPGQG